jgi:O-antigen/teichoic acid export membrane protein
MASFRKNFTILLVLQASTYLTPLLTLPWLTRILMPVGYGHLAFALAFANYFISLTNYSFGLTATSRIAIHRHDREQRSRIFWETMTAQFALTAVGFIVLIGLTLLVPTLAQERDLLLLGFCMAVGSLLTPTWYFQGTENLSGFSVIVFIGRTLSIPAIFLLVRTQDDVGWAMGINGMTALLTGIGGCVLLYLRHEIDFVLVHPRAVIKELKEGWSVFMATAIIEVYASSNIVLLTFIAGNAAAGYFAAGDKLVRASLNMLMPLKTAAYPRISFLMHHARDDAFEFLRKMLLIQGTVVLMISVMIFLGAPLAVKILYGPRFLETVDVLRWMAFVPFMVGLSDLFGVQTMIPLGMKTHFSRVLFASAPLNFALLAILAEFFGAQGAAATVLLVETSIAVAMATTLYMQRVPLLKWPVRE